MKSFRPALLLLTVLLFSTACQYSAPLGRSKRPLRYFKVRVTNPRSVLIAEWIAEGGVRRERDGYRFHAVQRLSGPPFQVLSKYPQPRNVYVTGPHIIVSPAGKPQWLYELDGF